MKQVKKIFFFAIVILAFQNVSKAQVSYFDENIVTIEISQGKAEAVTAGDTLSFQINVYIKDGFHINSNIPKEDFLIPVTIAVDSQIAVINKITFPKPEELKLRVSSIPVSAYTGNITIPVSIKLVNNIKPGKYGLNVYLGYQACNDERCFQPQTLIGKVNIEVGGDSHNHINKNTVRTIGNSDNHSGGINIFLAIIFAFAGGMILNLMPCVLPVLSIKIMGFIQQAGEIRSKTIKHGLAFTLGVLISFWVLAGLLIALRAGGEYLGWGFQLQSPAFIVILSILLFLFGLSMFGVFEIGTTLTSAGQNLKSTGYTGSFTSGVLATIVATPCTAPFMGTALGFALSQPVYVSLLVFTFLGLGMALPYVLLTSTPALLKLMPKPGRWMESFQQFMGFLLMGTVLWLIWVLSLQTGSEGVLFLLTSIIIAAVGGWIYGRWGTLAQPAKVRITALFISLIFNSRIYLFIN